MKKERLSDEIGKIDEDIIEEAYEKRQAGKTRRKSPLIVATSVFVAAAAAITGIVVIPKLNEQGDIHVSDVTTAITAPAQTDTTDIFMGAGEDDEHGGTFTRERRKSDIIADVSAVTASGTSIAPDSGLKLTLGRDVSEAELRSRIHLSPETGYTLTRENDGSYLLNTDVSFEKGSLIKLAVSDEYGDICDSWAFRTADAFEITSCYPRDKYNNVSVDSGIEIEFTAMPSLPDAQEHFSITPHVDGEFSVAGNTLCFIPNEDLKANAPYTVALSAGYLSADGEALAEGLSFSFRTTAYSNNDYIFTSSSATGFSESFLPDDRACVEIFCSESLRGRDFETHLYSFDDAEGYYAALKERAESTWAEDVVTDTTGLREVFTSSEAPFKRATDMKPRVYAMLPEQLDEGRYIAEISVTSAKGAVYTLQYLVQVSPVSVYALALGDENVFFVNNAADGLPAAGASVTLETDGGSYTATVGDDGIAYVKTKGETGMALLSIKYGSKIYNDCFFLSDAEDEVNSDKYFTYIYTDREAYLTTDTINVWGLILPRTRDASVPSGLSLVFDSESVPVTPASDGTFSASFGFRSHESSWMTPISLMQGNNELYSKHVSVRDYEKPTYVIDLDMPEYVVMPQKDPVPVTLNVSYYEGTPAEGVMLGSSNCDSEPEISKTDESGKADVNVKAQYAPNTWEVGTFTPSFSLMGVENTYTSGYKTVPALYHDRMLEYEFNDIDRTLWLKTFDLDLSRAGEFMKTIKSSADGWYYRDGDYDILKSGTCDIPLHVTITRSWTEKLENGSYYDHIEKKTVKLYNYNYRRETVYDRTVNTVNGELLLTDLPTGDSESSYTADITFADSFGQEMEVYDWGKSSSSYGLSIGENSLYYFSGSEYLVFRLDADTDDTATPDGESVFSTFNENDDITFRLRCSDLRRNFEGKLLLAVYRSDFVTYKVYDLNGGDTVSFRAGEECIPNAIYCGAYFDGKHIYTVHGSSIYFEPKERGIRLGLSSDAEKYDAGDTAEVTVTATDMSGRKLNGATVLLSVVDEAAFAIENQFPDPLRTLYRYIRYPSATSYISYIQHLAESYSGGEKGGGGGDATRKDFRDTAFFMSAVTDENGTARFSVKLPDNMTTWRATALAIYEKDTGRLLAGNDKLPIVVTRPVFITPIMHKVYVEGDDIALSAKCAGLENNGDITVALSGNGVDETRTIKQQETANFGKLSKGEYTVLFSAEKDGTRDAVEMPLTVTDTLLETDIVRAADLTELTKTISPTKWPVTVSFFNKDYMFCTDILYELLGYYGDSLDSRLAAACAAKELGFMTEDELIDEFTNETAEDFAKALPASQPSMELTARMAVAAPEVISPYAKEMLESPTGAKIGEACTAYMALAALGEPVLTDVKLLAEDVVYVRSGINLSSALALCGDYNGAYDMYMKFVPDITVDDSVPDAPTAYIALKNGSPDEGSTRAALITASLLGLPEAELFARHLVTSDPQYESCALELMTYVRSYVPEHGEEAVFTYKRGGAAQTVTLDKHHPTTLTFTEEQFAGADFTELSGKIYTISDYTGRVTENTAAPTIQVTKTITGSAVKGEEMTVQISAEPYSVIYDVIPSCGRRSDSYDNQGGQLIRLYTGKSGTVSYKFTVSTEGEYVVESAVAYDFRNDAWGMSSRSVLKVGDGNETA